MRNVLSTRIVVAAGLALAAAACGGSGGGSDPEYGARDLVVVDVDANGRDGVSLNTPLTIEFSEYVAPETIRHDTVQVRLGPRYGIQSPGDFKVSGNIVTFYPRLPVAPDISDAGLLPQSQYRITVLGHPSTNHVAAYTGRPLRRTFTADFATAASTSEDLFTTDAYLDDPPPEVRYTNPPDHLPHAPWTEPGGATDVPTDAGISVVFNRVPLLPSTITGNNVSLRMIERLGVPQNRAVQGTPILEQSFSGVSLRFVPAFPLADQARYVLRIENRVADLTGRYDVSDNAARVALRNEAESGLDPALAAFAIAHPEEVDPRTFLVFTTRDEPTKDLSVSMHFDGTDLDQDGGDGCDEHLTTASFDDAVPSAVAGVFTAAGGTGTLGDFHPSSNVNLSTNSPSAVNGAFHYRSIRIDPSITVVITGTLPATLLSLKDVVIEGTLGASGGKGDNAEANFSNSALPLSRGGAASAGGGKGGDCYTGTSWSDVAGNDGEDGRNGGGGGGRGGIEPSNTYMGLGGGGGGGGHQYAGSPGSAGTYPSTGTYNGAGGAGGAAAGIQPTSFDTDDGKDWYLLGVGGGGGGSGGNSHYYPTSTNYRQAAAGGGGGGGGILVKGAANVRVPGMIVAKGGDGGSVNPGYYYYGAAGGGGAGGSVALYANEILDVSAGLIDVSGGAGGTPYQYGYQGAGGKGGAGYIQLEDRDGAIDGIGGANPATLVPDHATGVFDPTGTAADAPSVYTSTWFNTGVFGPEIQPFTMQDFVDQVFPGCTIRYEIQMAVEDVTNFGKADTSSVNAVTGVSSDLAKASQWTVFRDPVAGIQDVGPVLHGRSYQFYRVRISFTLKDGQKRTDPVPYVDFLRIRFRY